MTLAGSTTLRWVVTTRTHGEVATAGISAGELEIVLLGVPVGFTPAEVEGWLADLAGVARETSATDTRVRAIPAILHHALTGLLFSHAELWHREGLRGPCSVAFVDTPHGPAFGWVGFARVQVLVDGVPMEPTWVRVRDDEGREARAFLFQNGAHLSVSLDHWPDGDEELAAPAAVEAEWSAAGVGDAGAAESTLASAPQSSGTAEPPAEAAAALSAEPVAEPLVIEPITPLPRTLPQDQPGLAGAPEREAAQAAPSAEAPALELAPLVPENETPEPSATLAHASEPPMIAAPALEPHAPATSEERTEEIARAGHPVGRWLSRIMSWGRKPAADEALEPGADAESGADAPHSGATAESAPLYGERPAPISAYDSLLSTSVPAEPAGPIAAAHEQTAIEWAATDVAHAPSSDATLSIDEAELMAASMGDETSVVESSLADHGVTAERVKPVPFEPIAGSIVEPKVFAPGVLEPSSIAPSLLAPSNTAQRSTEPAANVPPVIETAPIEPAVAEPTLAAPRIPQSPPPAPPRLVPETAAPSLLAPMPPLALKPPAPPPLPELDSRLPAATFASIFGGASAPPAPPATSPPVTGGRGAIGDVDASTLPVLSPPRLSGDPAPPVRVDHEPVGMHETFAIPKVPVRPQPPGAPPVLRVELSQEPPTAPIAITPTAAAPQGALPESPAPPTLSPDVVPAPARTASEDASPVATPPQWQPPTSSASAAGEPAAPSPESELAASPFIEFGEPGVRPAGVTRPRWPSPEELSRESAMQGRPWIWAAVVAVLFAVGWLLGGLQGAGKDEPSAFERMARAVGLGAPRFLASIDSDPPGAWIAIDGKDVAKRTPAKLELPPGTHVVTLSIPDLGSAKFTVKGTNGEKVALDQSLNGDLEILAADSGVPIAVSVDGKPQGYAPVKVESVAPGLHEVQFSGPGMPAWAQTIQVAVRTTAQLVAHPMAAPANGVIQAQALLNDEQGASALSGAQVFVDGVLRGATPISLELPRGPHSLRVSWRGETAPVQVIDLPGGNQRFATFNFGLELDAPRVTLLAPLRVMPANATTLISAQLTSLQPNEVREAWLHTLAPEGLWRRYPMNVMRSSAGTVVASVFPLTTFDAQGQTRWYVSAATQQGDEIFSEIQSASLAGAGAAPVRHRPAAPVAPATPSN